MQSRPATGLSSGNAHSIEGVATSIAAFVGASSHGPSDEPISITSFAEYGRRFGGLAAGSTMGFAVRDFFANGGTQAYVVRVTNESGGPIGEAQFVGSGFEANKRGLYALERIGLFNLLCVPPFAEDSDVTPGLIGAAAAYCEKRRAVFLIDAPADWITPSVALAKLNDLGTQSANAALFFPRVVERDGNQVRVLAPCGAIAGLYARTDTNQGVWKAPAGLSATLDGISDVTVPVTDAEGDYLNAAGINCLRSFSDRGVGVWGARTTQGADNLSSDWKYVPVRRLALFLEESIDRGTQWAVFEPNNEQLWTQIRLQVVAFMEGLFRQGAFQGATPEQAYFVKCDSETTTQADIDNGRLIIIIGCAPLKPAEFVIIRIQQFAGS